MTNILGKLTSEELAILQIITYSDAGHPHGLTREEFASWREEMGYTEAMVESAMGKIRRQMARDGDVAADRN